MKIIWMSLAPDGTGSDSVTGVGCQEKIDALLCSRRSLRAAFREDRHCVWGCVKSTPA